MTRRFFLSLVAAALARAEEDYKVYTENPRLLLRPQRLRLLRREREREAQRWLHFNALVSGKAQMAEPGFSLALHYQISQQESSAKQALSWAASNAATDIRQVALVFDWCGSLTSAHERTQIVQKLERSLQSNVTDIASARTRAFAAISLGEASPQAGAKALESLITKWWRASVAPALKAGERTVSSSEMYVLLELMHAIRDNLQIEMRDDALSFIRDVPAAQLLSYYPARYPAAENEYRIPFYTGKGEPDLRQAALSRAADMTFIAYDNNVVESQFLQGWVSNDLFQMKSTFAAPYELLWANPYQPGLSFHHMPLQFHDKQSGRLFLRSSWDDDATWAAYTNGRLQVFEEGKIQAAAAGSVESPAIVGPAAIATASGSLIKWKIKEGQPIDWFLVRLKPKTTYGLEVDDEELTEVQTDRGGILHLKLEREKVGVLIREIVRPV